MQPTLPKIPSDHSQSHPTDNLIRSLSPLWTSAAPLLPLLRCFTNAPKTESFPFQVSFATWMRKLKFGFVESKEYFLLEIEKGKLHHDKHCHTFAMRAEVPLTKAKTRNRSPERRPCDVGVHGSNPHISLLIRTPLMLRVLLVSNEVLPNNYTVVSCSTSYLPPLMLHQLPPLSLQK